MQLQQRFLLQCAVAAELRLIVVPDLAELLGVLALDLLQLASVRLEVILLLLHQVRQRAVGRPLDFPCVRFDQVRIDSRVKRFAALQRLEFPLHLLLALCPRIEEGLLRGLFLHVIVQRDILLGVVLHLGAERVALRPGAERLLLRARLILDVLGHLAEQVILAPRALLVALHGLLLRLIPLLLPSSQQVLACQLVTLIQRDVQHVAAPKLAVRIIDVLF